MLRGAGAVAEPGASTDPDHRGPGRGDAVDSGEGEPDAVRILGEQFAEHALEVRERARGEPVAPGRGYVHRVEGRQVVERGPPDLHPGAFGYPDIAAPLRVESRERGGGRASAQRKLEEVPGLDVGDRVSGYRFPAPAEGFEF